MSEFRPINGKAVCGQVSVLPLEKQQEISQAASHRPLLTPIVPQPQADLLFELVEEFELVAFAILVVQSGAHRAAGLSAPEPADLQDEVSAEVDFLAKVQRIATNIFGHNKVSRRR